MSDEMVRKEWIGHDAIIALRKPFPDAHEPENIVIGCTGCGWRSSESSFSGTGFGVHLSELGAPDYLVAYWSLWAEHVETPYGQLNRDAVARELWDYSTVMSCASTVFSEIADLSKPNTRPEAVIAANEDRMAERYAYQLCESAYDQLADGKLRTALAMIEVAESWHPPIWAQFSADTRERKAFMKRAQPVWPMA